MTSVAELPQSTTNILTIIFTIVMALIITVTLIIISFQHAFLVFFCLKEKKDPMA